MGEMGGGDQGPHPTAENLAGDLRHGGGGC
ncbi:unnamed protein product [Linum tenue]|uniref:Uncharacterized protein n=1 Tax=Linum tenue TaxID=586396 RepID=A0AAV0LJ94_9ROSI|nr:unnamed protein product [Linum tenue]